MLSRGKPRLYNEFDCCFLRKACPWLAKQQDAATIGAHCSDRSGSDRFGSAGTGSKGRQLYFWFAVYGSRIERLGLILCIYVNIDLWFGFGRC